MRRNFIAGLGALGFGLAGLVIACTQDAQRPDLPSTIGNPEPVAVLGADGTSQSALTTGSGSCENVGRFERTALKVSIGDALESTSWSESSRAQPLQLTVIGASLGTGVENQVVDLAEGANANLKTCTHCFVIALGCAGTDCSKAALFYPRSGTAVFTKVASTKASTSSTFEGHLDNADLVQVTVDGSSDESRPVARGGCMHIESLSFSGVKRESSSTTKGTPTGTGTTTAAPTTTNVPTNPTASPTNTQVGTGGGGDGGGGKGKIITNAS